MAGLNITITKNRKSSYVHETILIRLYFQQGVQICDQNWHANPYTKTVSDRKCHACHPEKSHWSQGLSRTPDIPSSVMWASKPCLLKYKSTAKNGNLNLMKNLWNIRLWIRITSLKQSYLWLCVNQPLTHENGLWNHTLESEHQHHEVCWPLTLQFVTEQIWGLRGITGTHPWHPLHFEDIPCQKRASCDVTRDLRLPMPTTRKTFKRALLCFY